MTRKKLNEHKNYKNPNMCELMIDNCPYSCDFEKKVLKSHLNVCENKPVFCQFSSLGCDYQGPRHALKQHNVENNHISIMLTRILDLEKLINNLNDKLQSVENIQLVEKIQEAEIFMRYKSFIWMIPDIR